MDLRDRFRGAMLGTAVGDSLGRPFEGRAPVMPDDVQRAASERQELKFSDDTQMTMDVAESLTECESFEGEHMAKLSARNHDPSRGYGPSTSQILEKIKHGELWYTPAMLAMDGKGSYGNGSAMRVAPVGLLYHQDPTKVREVAEASSKITHTHPLGVEGAAVQALAVSLAVQSTDFSAKDFLKRLIGTTKNETYLQKLKKVEGLLAGKPSPSEVAKELGNGIEAFNSVPGAIYCSLAFPSFRDAVLNAVALGGDADTIGAMTGAIAGARHGAVAIPEVWSKKLEGRQRLEELADGLFMLFVKEVLKRRCEICMTEEGTQVFKMDPDGGDDLSNFILLCPRCREESEEKGEEPSGKPKKHGKYRAVYRRVYGRT